MSEGCYVILLIFKQRLNMNEKERNDLAKQYLPLVKKITNQFSKKCGLDYDEIESFAWEGFTIAMNTYNPQRSNMNFTQFAGYGIRNAILSGINNTQSTISVSYYIRKKMNETGGVVPTTISIEKNFENDDHLDALGLLDDETPDENPWELLIEKIKKNFPDDIADTFFSVYGLDGHKVEKAKDIAHRMNVSGSLITKRIKKVVDFIRNDKELSNALRETL